MALNAGAMSFEEISQLLIFNEITTTGGDSTPPKP